MPDPRTSPLQFFRSLFAHPPEPKNLRIVSPKNVRPDDLRDMYSNTMAPLDRLYGSLDSSPRGYGGPIFDELVEKTATDQLLTKNHAQNFVQNQLQRIGSARGFTSRVIHDLDNPTPNSTHLFAIDPATEQLLGAIHSAKMKFGPRLGRALEGADTEEVKVLSGMMPGTGLPLMRAAQEIYDPKARRATSLTSMPKAESFYEGQAGMTSLVPNFVSDHDYRGVDWNYQSHIKPKGERFSGGGPVNKSPLAYLKSFFSPKKPSNQIHDPRTVDSAVKGDRAALETLAEQQGSSSSPASEILEKAVNAPLSRRSFLRGAASAAASNLIDTSALKHIQLPKFDVYPSLDHQFMNQLAEHGARFISSRYPHAQSLLYGDSDLPPAIHNFAEGLIKHPQFAKDPGLADRHEDLASIVGDITGSVDNAPRDAFELLMGSPNYKSGLRDIAIGSGEVPEYAVNRILNHPSFTPDIWEEVSRGADDDILRPMLEDAFKSAKHALKEGVHPDVVERLKSAWPAPRPRAENKAQPRPTPAELPLMSLNPTTPLRTSVDPQGSMTSIEPAAPRRELLPKFARGGALKRCRNAS